jgi:carnitine O-acetyltransferase
MEQIEVPTQVNSLSFKISLDIVDDINRAEMEFQKLYSSLFTGILHFLSYGKAFITKYGVSPDALVQIAFQVTQFKIFGKLGSTYESALTKKYYHGRTECMRPVTNEMLAFVTCLCNPGSTASEQLQLFTQAAKAHVNKVALCKTGEGVDRHLYGMQNLAKQLEQRLPNYSIPDIYTDVAWSKLRHDYLSTSNCGGYSLSSFGFGPVVPDGLGIDYIIKDKCMHFHVTAFSERPTKKFVKFMEQSLLEIGQLLVSSTPFTLRTNLNYRENERMNEFNNERKI